LVLVVAGCGGSDAASSDAATQEVESGRVAVDAVDNAFRRAEITVAPGTEVVWTNKGRSEHDVMPVDGGDWGVAPSAFGPDVTYSYRFTEPGTYAYYCTLHGTKTKGMIGTVTVPK
jgi:plastocyanin